MRYRLSIFLFACALALFAIPAKRRPFTVKLVDGSTATVTLCGDENYHYIATTEGTPVVEVSEGIYRLAPELKDSISIKWENRAKNRNAHRFAKSRAIASQNRQRKAFGYPTAYSGKKKGVVILVNFSDKSFKPSTTREIIEEQFNKVGYNKNNHIGSVHDYFYEASYGKFDLEFDVFGPVTVSKTMAHYGKNNRDGDDLYPGELVIEACRLAHKQNSINWSDYDWDNDGYVDQVFVIYAGYGEHAGAASNTIWPHECTLTEEAKLFDGSGPINLSGTKIDTYAVSCELNGTSGNTISGIGTACHEFSHCLGIPDFYDTSYNGGYGMNFWDLMDTGSYSGPNSDGEVPTGYTAYERWFAGWLEPIELKSSCHITSMPAINKEPIAYIIYNDANRNEYYIIENRQNTGFFTYTDNVQNLHGLLVTHVDYNEELWTNNYPNDDAKHQRMSIIPAGNTYGTKSYSGGYFSDKVFSTQLFPGTWNVTELNNDSHIKCNGKLFNRNTDGSYNMNKIITNISESNRLISFDFRLNSEDPTSVLATSSESAECEYYTLGGVKVSAPSTPGVYLVKKGDKFQKMLIGR